MSQTFTAPLPCHRAAYRSNASGRPTRVNRAGFVANFAQAPICYSKDRLLIPVHD